MQRLQSKGFQESPPWISANRGGRGPSGAAHLVGDGLNYNADIAGDLSHVADLEPSLGLVAHQDTAEDELVFILHKQPPGLCGLQHAVQVGTAADLVLLKDQGVVVSHEGWGVEGRL